MADLDNDADVIVVGDDADTASVDEAGVVILRDDGESEHPLPKRAIEHKDGSIELPLLHPVTLRFRTKSSATVREETISRLVLHRMLGPDMRAISAASGDSQIVVVLARSARISEGKFGSIFDRMDAEDISDASQIVGRFLGNGRKTGR
ncbi:hypothetical protein ACQW02_19945 [Humitalea sp. 24SJ18S-53]|uniref:hypothetical protein n=1 Tax=Humitalea sp. 24SJ18S-53 TaxID=3422307 RepID=UPI003D67AE58